MATTRHPPLPASQCHCPSAFAPQHVPAPVPSLQVPRRSAAIVLAAVLGLAVCLAAADRVRCARGGGPVLLIHGAKAGAPPRPPAAPVPRAQRRAGVFSVPRRAEAIETPPTALDKGTPIATPPLSAWRLFS